MTFLGFCSKQTFLNEQRMSLLILFLSISLLVYFNLHFTRFTYRRAVKTFESMNTEEFQTARKTYAYAKINEETMQAYRDVSFKRIIKENNLNENEISLWLRECMSSD